VEEFKQFNRTELAKCETERFIGELKYGMLMTGSTHACL